MFLNGCQSLISRTITGLLRSFFWLLYNPFAWTYDRVASIVSLGAWNEWVQTVIPIITDEPILEIGHGPGHLQKELLETKANAFGLDLSPWMGRITHKRLQKANIPSPLVRGTAFNLPFPGGYFGSVVSTFPSEYIADIRSQSEIMRVLKPSGRLVILPFAWITGKSWLERLAAWLFRATGESPELPDDGKVPLGIHGEWLRSLIDSAEQLGFIVTFQMVKLETSCVLIILAEKATI